MPTQPSFSERQGLRAPTEIVYRDTLPHEVRQPIFDIVRRFVPTSFIESRCVAVLNPYGIAEMPSGPAVPVTDEENRPDIVAAKTMMFNCEWFRVYDIIEDIFAQLSFHEEELASPDEEPRTYPFQEDINRYFRYAGIGWQMVDGQIFSRSSDAFEDTVKRARTELSASGRTTASDRIRKAIENLSVRPSPDYSGAISHATGAMECVLHDITGQEMTLGRYLQTFSQLFAPSLRKALDGLWGYSSEEGARHGREGVEPPREEAEFIVTIASAFTTYLNRKHPRV